MANLHDNQRRDGEQFLFFLIEKSFDEQMKRLGSATMALSMKVQCRRLGIIVDGLAMSLGLRGPFVPDLVALQRRKFATGFVAVALRLPRTA